MHDVQFMSFLGWFSRSIICHMKSNPLHAIVVRAARLENAMISCCWYFFSCVYLFFLSVLGLSPPTPYLTTCVCARSEYIVNDFVSIFSLHCFGSAFRSTHNRTMLCEYIHICCILCASCMVFCLQLLPKRSCIP